MDWKKTLLMPQTKFPMRANLPVLEPRIHQLWKKEAIYQTYQDHNKGKPEKILHDGPPYANGSIHVGHALNKILKDFVVRYWNTADHYSPYVMGWDTHGLPIENALLKRSRKTGQLEPLAFRQACQEYAAQQANNQAEQFSQLGIFTNFNERYYTYEKSYEASQVRLFSKFAAADLIYRAKKPVYWSPSSHSALAEAEIIYAPKRSPSVYVGYETTGKDAKLPAKTRLIIWTTTPWTLAANAAICANPNATYALVKFKNDHYLCGSLQWKTKLQDLFNWQDAAVVKEFKGTELVGIQYVNYLVKNELAPLLTGEHVSENEGTGLVHTSPGFGEDDYQIGRENNLLISAPLDEYGRFTKEVSWQPLVGMFYEKANPLILEHLGKKVLLATSYEHSYPHDWRTKKPVIYRATPQWFINIAALQKRLTKAASAVDWYPDWGEKRMHQMILNRKEWCISRQRLWGVPLPIVYDKNKKPLFDEKVFEHIAKLFDKHGSDIWFTEPASTFVPPNHPSSGPYKKETDIMDVWFDSGSSHLHVRTKYGWKEPFIYLEGNDQLRGWFNSSLTTGVMSRQEAPYQAVVVHGMTLDNAGIKMSKSIGNVVDPLKVCRTHGADILRLWTSLVNYQDDVRLSGAILAQTGEHYRKIRNTLRFLAGNLADFNPETDQVPFNKMGFLSRNVLTELNDLIDNQKTAFEEFQFMVFMNRFLNYCIRNLSGFYLDLVKDTLYCAAQNSFHRREVQTVLYCLLNTFQGLLWPVLPHTITELRTYLPAELLGTKKLVLRPETFPINLPAVEQTEWEALHELRTVVNRAVEKAKQENLLSSGLAAQILVGSNPTWEKLNRYDLPTLLLVGEVQFVDSLPKEQAKAVVFKADKCPRCWRYFKNLDNSLCSRCTSVAVV